MSVCGDYSLRTDPIVAEIKVFPCFRITRTNWSAGSTLLLNGKPPQKNFLDQVWSQTKNMEDHMWKMASREWRIKPVPFHFRRRQKRRDTRPALQNRAFLCRVKHLPMMLIFESLDASTVYPHDQFPKFQARRQQPHDRPSSRSYQSRSVAPGVAPNLSHLLKLTA